MTAGSTPCRGNGDVDGDAASAVDGVEHTREVGTRPGADVEHPRSRRRNRPGSRGDRGRDGVQDPCRVHRVAMSDHRGGVAVAASPTRAEQCDIALAGDVRRMAAHARHRTAVHTHLVTADRTDEQMMTSASIRSPRRWAAMTSFVGHADRGRAVVDAELRVDVQQVRLDRGLADEQPAADSRFVAPCATSRSTSSSRALRVPSAGCRTRPISATGDPGEHRSPGVGGPHRAVNPRAGVLEQVAGRAGLDGRRQSRSVSKVVSTRTRLGRSSRRAPRWLSRRRARHPQVQQDHVRRQAVDHGRGLLTVARLAHTRNAGSAANMPCSPSRTTGWSSTSSTRIVNG